MSGDVLNKAMLLGLLGVALPVLIHLLNRRRDPVIDWGAMQFLELGRLARPGRSGVGRMRGALQRRGLIGAPRPSVLECRTLRLLRQHGIEPLATQVHCGPDGRYRVDFNQNDIRLTGIEAGLVDYKICAVDADWSGMKFARRRK